MCQPTKCEGQLSMTELREAFLPSWLLRLFYCICSQWLQATLTGPAPVAFRHILLCLIKESAGVCCHASSLCTHTPSHLCACNALRCKVVVPLGVHPFACLNMPLGGSFCAQLESGLRQLDLNLQGTHAVPECHLWAWVFLWLCKLRRPHHSWIICTLKLTHYLNSFGFNLLICLVLM